MKNKKVSFDPYDFEKVTIEKVLVYYRRFETAPCIHINFCFNNGAFNDHKENAGISHFLEHMIFNGSPKIPNKKAVKEWGKINTLNSWNAWTFFTNTNYHLKCLPEKFETVILGMTDMIFNPLLKDKDVEHERKVITEEAWGVYKNEKLLKYLKEILDNSYSKTIRTKTLSPLGYPETIAKIKRNDILKWHKGNYGRGNFFVVISGNITKEHIDSLGKILKTIPEISVNKIKFGKISKPKRNVIVKNSDEIGDPREQAEVSFERVFENRNLSEEVIYMANSLLSDLLFERLRIEKGLCYSVSVNPFIQKDFTSWGINLKTNEENIEIVKKEFWKIVEKITSGKEKKRFETLKKVKIDQLKSLEEVTEDFTRRVLDDIWKFGKIKTKESILKEREDVKYKDVTDCLKKSFKKDWTFTEVILPTKKFAN